MTDRSPLFSVLDTRGVPPAVSLGTGRSTARRHVKGSHRDSDLPTANMSYYSVMSQDNDESESNDGESLVSGPLGSGMPGMNMSYVNAGQSVCDSYTSGQRSISGANATMAPGQGRVTAIVPSPGAAQSLGYTADPNALGIVGATIVPAGSAKGSDVPQRSSRSQASMMSFPSMSVGHNSLAAPPAAVGPLIAQLQATLVRLQNLAQQVGIATATAPPGAQGFCRTVSGKVQRPSDSMERSSPPQRSLHDHAMDSLASSMHLVPGGPVSPAQTRLKLTPRARPTPRGDDISRECLSAVSASLTAVPFAGPHRSSPISPRQIGGGSNASSTHDGAMAASAVHGSMSLHDMSPTADAYSGVHGETALDVLIRSKSSRVPRSSSRRHINGFSSGSTLLSGVGTPGAAPIVPPSQVAPVLNRSFNQPTSPVGRGGAFPTGAMSMYFTAELTSAIQQIEDMLAASRMSLGASVSVRLPTTIPITMDSVDEKDSDDTPNGHSESVALGPDLPKFAVAAKRSLNQRGSNTSYMSILTPRKVKSMTTFANESQVYSCAGSRQSPQDAAAPPGFSPSATPGGPADSPFGGSPMDYGNDDVAQWLIKTYCDEKHRETTGFELSIKKRTTSKRRIGSTSFRAANSSRHRSVDSERRRSRMSIKSVKSMEGSGSTTSDTGKQTRIKGASASCSVTEVSPNIYVETATDGSTSVLVSQAGGQPTSGQDGGGQRQGAGPLGPLGDDLIELLPDGGIPAAGPPNLSITLEGRQTASEPSTDDASEYTDGSTTETETDGPEEFKGSTVNDFNDTVNTATSSHMSPPTVNLTPSGILKDARRTTSGVAGDDTRPRRVSIQAATFSAEVDEPSQDDTEAVPTTRYRRSAKRSYPSFCKTRQYVRRLKAVGIPRIDNVNDPNFDVFECFKAQGSETLTAVAVNIFFQYNFVSSLEMDLNRFVAFCAAVEACYRYDNPYHNAIHGADVLQTTHVYLCVDNVKENFSDLELFAVLFSAMVHDVGHVGVDNNFLVKSRHPIARIYSDKSPMESMHACFALSIMDRPECNFLADSSSWTNQLSDDFRGLVAEVIAGTDMKFHNDLTTNIREILEDGNIDDDEVGTLFKGIVHAADLSNPMKPTHIYCQWVERVLAEFWRQGDEERRLGLPISLLCDRSTSNVSKSQVGFINFVILPYMTVLSPVLPPIWIERLRCNLEYMQHLSGSEEAARTLAITTFADIRWRNPTFLDPHSFLFALRNDLATLNTDLAPEDFESPQMMAASRRASSQAASVADAPPMTGPQLPPLPAFLCDNSDATTATGTDVLGQSHSSRGHSTSLTAMAFSTAAGPFGANLLLESSAQRSIPQHHLMLLLRYANAMMAGAPQPRHCALSPRAFSTDAWSLIRRLPFVSAAVRDGCVLAVDGTPAMGGSHTDPHTTAPPLHDAKVLRHKRDWILLLLGCELDRFHAAITAIVRSTRFANRASVQFGLSATSPTILQGMPSYGSSSATESVPDTLLTGRPSRQMNSSSSSGTTSISSLQLSGQRRSMLAALDPTVSYLPPTVVQALALEAALKHTIERVLAGELVINSAGRPTIAAADPLQEVETLPQNLFAVLQQCEERLAKEAIEPWFDLILRGDEADESSDEDGAATVDDPIVSRFETTAALTGLWVHHLARSGPTPVAAAPPPPAVPLSPPSMTVPPPLPQRRLQASYLLGPRMAPHGGEGGIRAVAAEIASSRATIEHLLTTYREQGPPKALAPVVRPPAYRYLHELQRSTPPSTAVASPTSVDRHPPKGVMSPARLPALSPLS